LPAHLALEGQSISKAAAGAEGREGVAAFLARNANRRSGLLDAGRQWLSEMYPSWAALKTVWLRLTALSFTEALSMRHRTMRPATVHDRAHLQMASDRRPAQALDLALGEARARR
jgi:hypothetical protein